MWIKSRITEFVYANPGREGHASLSGEYAVTSASNSAHDNKARAGTTQIADGIGVALGGGGVAAMSIAGIGLPLVVSTMAVDLGVMGNNTGAVVNLLGHLSTTIDDILRFLGKKLN